MVDTLTFGIELEFIAVHKIDGHNSIIGEMIYNGLLQAGIPATGYEDLDDDINADDGVPPHSRWRVEDDTLGLSREEIDLLPDDWTEEWIELSSRKFKFYGDDWKGEIARVLEVLRSIEGANCRFLTNASTGFHVHVGYDTAVVPLRTAKNVFQLMTAFERQLAGIHPSNRHSPLGGYPNHPLSAFHRRQGENWNRTVRKKANMLLDRLYDIETLESYEELGAVFQVVIGATGGGAELNGHVSTVNFDNLYTNHRDDPITGTIEFRQHTGTLDLLTIQAWVILTTRIVQYSRWECPVEFVQLLTRGVELDFLLRQVLESIGCRPDAIAFYCEEDGSRIGILSPPHSQGPVNTPALDPLFERLDWSFASRSDRASVSKAIRIKDYGLATRNVPFPPIDVPAYMWEAWTHVLGSWWSDSATQVIRSAARITTLGEFAEIYARELERLGVKRFNKWA